MNRFCKILFLAGGILLYGSFDLVCQPTLTCYNKLLKEGDQLKKQKNFGEAINKYTAAYNCNHIQGYDTLSKRIENVIHLLELARIKAEDDEELARQKEKEVIIERDKALQEKKEKEAARDSATIYAKRAEALFLTAQSQILLDKNDLSQDPLLLSFAGLMLADQESKQTAYTAFVKAAYKIYSGGSYFTNSVIKKFYQLPFSDQLLIHTGSNLLLQKHNTLPVIVSSHLSPGANVTVSTRPEQFVTWGYASAYGLVHRERLREVKLHSQPILSLAYSFDNKYVISGGRDSLINVYPLFGAENKSIKAHTGNVYEVVPRPHSSDFLSRSSDGTIRVWNIDGTLKNTFHGKYFQATTYSSNGNFLAGVDAGERVTIWDSSGTVVDTFSGSILKDIKDLIFIKDEPKLFLVARDKILLAEKNKGVKVIRYAQADVNGLMINSYGDHFLTWTKDGSLKYSAVGSYVDIDLKYGDVEIIDASISVDNKYILSTAADGNVALHDIEGWKIHTWKTDPDEPIAAQFSKDGQAVYVAAIGNTTIRKFYLPHVILAQQENVFDSFREDFNRLASQYGLKYLSALENR